MAPVKTFRSATARNPHVRHPESPRLKPQHTIRRTESGGSLKLAPPPGSSGAPTNSSRGRSQQQQQQQKQQYYHHHQRHPPSPVPSSTSSSSNGYGPPPRNIPRHERPVLPPPAAGAAGAARIPNSPPSPPELVPISSLSNSTSSSSSSFSSNASSAPNSPARAKNRSILRGAEVVKNQILSAGNGRSGGNTPRTTTRDKTPTTREDRIHRGAEIIREQILSGSGSNTESDHHHPHHHHPTQRRYSSGRTSRDVSPHERFVRMESNRSSSSSSDMNSFASSSVGLNPYQKAPMQRQQQQPPPLPTQPKKRVEPTPDELDALEDEVSKLAVEVSKLVEVKGHAAVQIPQSPRRHPHMQQQQQQQQQQQGVFMSKHAPVTPSPRGNGYHQQQQQQQHLHHRLVPSPSSSLHQHKHYQPSAAGSAGSLPNDTSFPFDRTAAHHQEPGSPHFGPAAAGTGGRRDFFASHRHHQFGDEDDDDDDEDDMMAHHLHPHDMSGESRDGSPPGGHFNHGHHQSLGGVPCSNGGGAPVTPTGSLPNLPRNGPNEHPQMMQGRKMPPQTAIPPSPKSTSPNRVIYGNQNEGNGMSVHSYSTPSSPVVTHHHHHHHHPHQQRTPPPTRNMVQPGRQLAVPPMVRLLNDPAYRHATKAGRLWQTLVGEHVRFPKTWWNGARTPDMGDPQGDSIDDDSSDDESDSEEYTYASSDDDEFMTTADTTLSSVPPTSPSSLPPPHIWTYISRHRVRNEPNLNHLISNRRSSGKILLHVVIRDSNSWEPKMDVAVGAYHPNARGIRRTEEPDKRDEDVRLVWMGIRYRSKKKLKASPRRGKRKEEEVDDNGIGTGNIIDGVLTQGRPFSLVGKKSPIGDRHKVNNDNVRAIYGDEPPRETVFVLENELYKLMIAVNDEERERGIVPSSPSLLLLNEYVFRRRR